MQAIQKKLCELNYGLFMSPIYKKSILSWLTDFSCPNFQTLGLMQPENKFTVFIK